MAPDPPAVGVLIIGCGADSIYWKELNAGGTTVFIEYDPERHPRLTPGDGGGF